MYGAARSDGVDERAAVAPVAEIPPGAGFRVGSAIDEESVTEMAELFFAAERMRILSLVQKTEVRAQEFANNALIFVRADAERHSHRYSETIVVLSSAENIVELLDDSDPRFAGMCVVVADVENSH